MWLVIADDVERAHTMAHWLADGQATALARDHGIREIFVGGQAQGGIVATEGLLQVAHVGGRGHPAERPLEWISHRRRAQRTIARHAPHAVHVAVATAPGERGDLLALQVMRAVRAVDPLGGRRVRRITPRGTISDPLTALSRVDIPAGLAAETGIGIDALWEALLGDVIAETTRHALPALALLAGGRTLTDALAHGALTAAGLPGAALETLRGDGLVFGVGSVRVAPAGVALVERLLRSAPGLLDPATANAIDASVRRVAVDALTPERVIEQARALLRQIAPMARVAPARGDVEGRVLGWCRDCDRPMLPRADGNGGRHLVCGGGGREGCGLVFPLPTSARVRPGGGGCPACGAPTIRVSVRGWESAPRCAAALDCPAATPVAT